jgi:arylsulfatase A-like enzyme/Tfp pilus assembly protein PilF
MGRAESSSTGAARWLRRSLLLFAIVACGDGREGRNVVLISIDTLRADRLGSYGYSGAATPRMDDLAARGVRFEQASTVTPLTLPAHTSLLTGTFPAFHGVRDNGGFYVEDGADTLAEALASRGYRTGAFVASFVLDSRWGLDQGFETYHDDFDLSEATTGAMDDVQRRGEDVVDRALDWVERARDGPFFAWLHLYDPHTPYDAPEPFRSRFPETVSGAYDAEIAYIDHQVGRVLDFLRGKGLERTTLVAVVSDHGESLGEHGEQTHGFFLYESTLRVPLILAGPGVPREVVTDPVRIVDLMPTFLELLGFEAPDAVQGESLAAAMRGEPFDAPVYAETFYPRYHYGWSELQSFRRGEHKLVAAPRREVYDLASDPIERADLVSVRAGLASSLEEGLDRFLEATKSLRGERDPAPMDPAVEERLHALGYLGAGRTGRRGDSTEALADPKDRIGLYNRLKAASTDYRYARFADALAKLDAVVAEDDAVVEAHSLRGNSLLKLGRLEEAVDAFRRALEVESAHEGAAFNLALTYKELGRFGDAQTGFERLLELDPRSGKARWHLADLLMVRKEHGAAEAMLRTALEGDVDRPAFLLKLGECHLEQGELEEAERSLREAIDLRPKIPRAWYDLGLVLAARNDLAGARSAFERELESQPRDGPASFELGKLLLREKKPTEAVARLRVAVEVDERFAAGHLYLAKALLEAGELESAKRSAHHGLRLDPDPGIRALGHYVLADVYRREGRLAEAEREIDRAERLDSKTEG